MPLEEIAQGKITQAELDKLKAEATKTQTPTLPTLPTGAGYGGTGPTAGSAGGPPKKPTFTLPGLPTGDDRPTGRDRLGWETDQFMAAHGGDREAYDSWVVTLPLDPLDSEYNRMLEAAKRGAQKRIRERWEKKYKPKEPTADEAGPPKITEEQEIKYVKEQGRAYEKEVKQIQTTPIFQGTPLKDQQAKTTTPVPSGEGATGDINAAVTGEETGAPETGLVAPQGSFIDPTNPQKTLEMGRKSDGWRGSWVFVGYVTVTDSRGNTHRQAKYISDQEAYGDFARNKPDDIREFQKAFGLAETGVADQKTMAVWRTIVDATTAMNLAGQNVTLGDVMGMYLAGDAKKRGGSGGGGGGGGGNIDLSSAKSILSQTMKELIGREPTEGEARTFWKKLQGEWRSSGGNMDPGQFTTDYVRSNYTAEAGETSTQNYYSAMLSVLGGGMTGG